MNTTETMRKLLLEEMNKVASGASSPSRARAVASLAKASIATKQLEIAYASFTADRGDIAKPLAM